MVKIITDTAADITRAQAQEMGVELVALNVSFGDTPYDAAADENFSLFYKLLDSSKDLPTTSQPPPTAYLDIIEQAAAAGDDVIIITLDSKLSGTYQSANIAKDMSEYDRVWVIDSHQAVIGQRLLVEYAVALRDKGLAGYEMAVLLHDASKRIVLFAALDTLKYLRKGGRIPKSAEIIGTVMSVKPIITLDPEGNIITAGKARGHAGAVTTMIKLMDENANVDPAAPVYFGYTRDEAPSHAFRKLASARYHLTNTKEYPVGATVGTHIGPGAFAVAYLAKGTMAE